MMTNQQEKEIIRVCGKNWEQNDIPAIWRQEWLEKGLMTEEERQRIEKEMSWQEIHGEI